MGNLKTIERLHYVSQQPQGGTHLDAIKKVLVAGGRWVQLRVKQQPEEVILQLALKSRKYCDHYGAKLIINDHPRIALEAKADGVHLGLDDMPVAEARRIMGTEAIIGGTANTFQDMLQRVSEGADYIGLGPYRFTATKANLSPVLGQDQYRLLMQQVKTAGIRTPIIAIGGILTKDIRLLRAEGLYGVAVSGALTGNQQLSLEIGKMYEELELY